MEINHELIEFLMDQGGPILRWRAAFELAPDDPLIDREALHTELVASTEVQRWLNLLGSGPVHHSKDSSVENILAKLGEYGLRAGLPELDEKAQQYFSIGEGEHYHDEALILVPFLVRLGYAGEPQIANWLVQRIDILYDLACSSEYDVYMDETERQCLPASQRNIHGSSKPFYKLQYNSHWSVLGLPTCYDLYTLAYLPKYDPVLAHKVESIITYLLHPDFQETPGGYIWNIQRHRPYAAGRVFLACLPRQNEPQKAVLFLNMLAHFEAGRNNDWFRNGISHLETFRTGRGSYLFPSNYLSEKSGYYLYAGMHMGLGEWPRYSRALELESTFRILRLKMLSA